MGGHVRRCPAIERIKGGNVTFTEKLARINADLQSIVTRMNADESFELANAAQAAVIAVANLEKSGGGWFMDLDWGWKPKRASERITP